MQIIRSRMGRACPPQTLSEIVCEPRGRPLRKRATAMRSPCLDMVSKSSPLDRKPHQPDKRKSEPRAGDCCRSARLLRQQRQLLVLTQARGLVFHSPKNVARTVEVTAQKSPRAPKGSWPTAPMSASLKRLT